MSDLVELATRLIRDGPVKTQIAPKRVRVLFGGAYVADSATPTYVWEHKYFPQYYFNCENVKDVTWGKDIADGKACLGALTVDKRSTNRVLMFKEGPLKDLVRIEFGTADKWFEEDTPIYVHPRDPNVRVDTLRSSRHIVVKIDGVTVADSSSSIFLFETGLPSRYYIPQTFIVNWKFLSPSETVTSCPYKGDANYFDVTVNGKIHKDAIWWYRYPTPECISIAGSLCFYNEKVDVWIDGIKEEKPNTKFS